MRDSIIYSSVRALMVALCTVFGLCFGLALALMAISGFNSSSDENKMTRENTEEILPNASGVRSSYSDTAPVILQINIDQAIGSEALNANIIRQLLVESREGSLKNDRIKAIFLYIDSPGGIATDVDVIFHALLDYKKKYNIPIYAYVDGICASGSFYIALAADKIFASNVSLIGSVGVISPPFLNYHKLLDKIGVESLTIFSGKGKDAMNPLRPWTEDEDKNYRQINQYYYNNFVDLVTTYRPKIDKQKLIQEYGAHVFPAPTAMEYGYVDVSDSSLHAALSELVSHVGITDDNYQVIRLENKNWFKNLFSSQTSLLFKGKVQHSLSVSPEVDLLLQNKYLYLYSGH